MTNFSDFGIIFDNLVEYFAGTYPVLATIFILLFLVIMLTVGLDVRYATLFILPMVAAFVAVGWFGSAAGDSQWIINVALMIVSVFYAFAVLRLTT